MKNVQVIDDAFNCTFSIFQFTDQQFALIFPGDGQDIAFADELEAALSDAELQIAFDGAWNRPVQKCVIEGLHGTLIYGLNDRKEYFPESRRECDWDESSVNIVQRRLNESIRRRLDQ